MPLTPKTVVGHYLEAAPAIFHPQPFPKINFHINLQTTPTYKRRLFKNLACIYIFPRSAQQAHPIVTSTTALP